LLGGSQILGGLDYRRQLVSGVPKRFDQALAQQFIPS